MQITSIRIPAGTFASLLKERPMQVIQPDDPRLDHIFQGVRQAYDGQCYREGRFKDGSVAYVDATDSRQFHLSDGTFTKDTKHVIVVDSNGVARRCSA